MAATISVNLSGEPVDVRADVYPATTAHEAFMSFDVGPLTVILPSAEVARQLAEALHEAVDQLDVVSGAVEVTR